MCSMFRDRMKYAVLAFTAFAILALGTSSSAQVTNSVETLRNTKTSPEKLSASFAEVARIVEPAVVNIDTKGKVPDVTAKGEKENSDDILESFRRQIQQRPMRAVGSGFIVDKAGYILTNAHVIEDAARIIVRLDSGEEYTGQVVGIDTETDLAVLKIDAGKDLPFVKIGNSDRAQVGDWVLAIGSPFGLARTVTAGIVSQTNRETPYASAFQKFIQTDAAINRGNSGGPLVNMDGEVIGVNSQIATSTGDYNGIGFALPSNQALNVYNQIRQNGKVRRGYLGVSLDSVKTEYAKVYGLPEAKGAIVTDIREKQGAAAKAGLAAGDVIVEFNGQKIESAQDLITKVAATIPEQTVSVIYYRETGEKLERKSLTLKLDERPSRDLALGSNERKVLPVNGGREEAKPFGLTLAELTSAMAATYNFEGQKGLLVKEINPASFIADVKSSTGDDALYKGDLIQRINRVTVADLKTFNEVARNLKTGDAVVLHVLSNNRMTRAPQFKIVQFTVQ